MTQDKAHPTPPAVPTNELLPCPFCGNVAEFKPYKRDGLTLQCKTLGCVTFNQRVLRYSLEWLEGKMIESWNTRAAPVASNTTAEPELSAWLNDREFHELAMDYRGAVLPTAASVAFARLQRAIRRAAGLPEAP